jgi:hypothetical protein
MISFLDTKCAHCQRTVSPGNGNIHFRVSRSVSAIDHLELRHVGECDQYRVLLERSLPANEHHTLWRRYLGDPTVSALLYEYSWTTKACEQLGLHIVPEL